MPSTYGTCSVCHSVNVRVFNTMCGSCAVILSKAFQHAQESAARGHDAAEGLPLWEVVESADNVSYWLCP